MFESKIFVSIQGLICLFCFVCHQSTVLVNAWTIFLLGTETRVARGREGKANSLHLIRWYLLKFLFYTAFTSQMILLRGF